MSPYAHRVPPDVLVERDSHQRLYTFNRVYQESNLERYLNAALNPLRRRY